MKYSIVKKDGYIRISKKKNDWLYDLEDIQKIDLNNYICLKGTRNFRIVDNDEVYNMKNANYVLLDKQKFDLEYVLKWLEFFRKTNIVYLMQPFPALELIEKIRFK